jgi:hypothetical protein
MEKFTPIPEEYNRIRDLPTFKSNEGTDLHYDREGNVYKLNVSDRTAVVLRTGLFDLDAFNLQNMWEDAILKEAQTAAKNRRALVMTATRTNQTVTPTQSNLQLPRCALCAQPFDTFGDTCQACLTKNFDAESGTVQAPPMPTPSDSVLQDVAEIYRKDNVFINSLTVLTGAEAVAIDIEHENFVYNNVLRDANGDLYPDWNTRGQNHIANMKRMVETFRVKDGSTRRALALTRAAELEKLTPEEREAWKKSLDKPAAARASSAVAELKTAAKRQTLIEKQIAGLLAIPGMTEDSDLVKTLRAVQAKK